MSFYTSQRLEQTPTDRKEMRRCLVLSRSHRASHGLHRHFTTQLNTTTAPSTTAPIPDVPVQLEHQHPDTSIPGEQELRSSYQHLLATDIGGTDSSDMPAKATVVLSKLSKLFQDLGNNTTTYQPKHAFVSLRVWEKTLHHAPNETLCSVEQCLPQIESVEARRHITQQLQLTDHSDPEASAKLHVFDSVQRQLTVLNGLKKRKNLMFKSSLYGQLLATTDKSWCTFSATYGRATTLIPPSLIALNMQVLQACSSYVAPTDIVTFIRKTLFHHIPATLQPIELHNIYLQQLCAPKNKSENGTAAAIHHLHVLEHQQLPRPDIITYSIVLSAMSKSSAPTKHQDIIDIMDRSVLLNRLYNPKYGMDPSKKITPQRTARRQIRETGQTARKALDQTQLKKNTMKDIQSHQDGWAWLQTLDSNTTSIRDVEHVLEHQLTHIEIHKAPTKVASYALQNTYSNGFMEALDRMPSDRLTKDGRWSNQVKKLVQYIQQCNKTRRRNHSQNTTEQPLHLLEMNTATCNLLLKGCALSRDKDCAQKIWNNMICVPTKTTSTATSAAATTTNNNNNTTNTTTDTDTDTDTALPHQYRIVPDKDTRYFLMASILNAAGSLEEIQQYWQCTTDLQPRMVTINNVLKRIVNHSGVSGGLQFLNKQTTSSKHSHLVAPDVYTLNILLKGCAKEGQVGAAFSLLNGARLTWNNVVPNVMSYTTLMQCYRTNNDPIGAYSAFVQMLQHDIVPDNVACARMVQTFAEFGEEEAASRFLIQAKNNGWIDYQMMGKLEEYVACFEETEEDAEGAEDEDGENDASGVVSYDEEYDGGGREESRPVFLPSLVPVPGEEMLSISHDRDQWLLNEISMLTPANSGAGTPETTAGNNLFQQPLTKEEMMADVNNELRLFFEKDTIRFSSIEKK